MRSGRSILIKELNTLILKYWYSAELFQQRGSQKALCFCVSLLQLYNAVEAVFAALKLSMLIGAFKEHGFRCMWLSSQTPRGLSPTLAVRRQRVKETLKLSSFMGNRGRSASMFTTATSVNHSSSMSCLVTSFTTNWRFLWSYITEHSCTWRCLKGKRSFALVGFRMSPQPRSFQYCMYLLLILF